MFMFAFQLFVHNNILSTQKYDIFHPPSGLTTALSKYCSISDWDRALLAQVFAYYKMFL